MFSALFAAYAVLAGNTAGGPTGARAVQPAQCLHRDGVPAVLELSPAGSGCCRPSGGSRAASCFRRAHLRSSARPSCSSRSAEFAGMVAEGAGPSRSAFLSAFFTLVGTHGAARHRRAWSGSSMMVPGHRQGLAAARAAAPVLLQPVLARAGHRLGRRLHVRLPGSALMANFPHRPRRRSQRQPPGIERSQRGSVLKLPRGAGFRDRADAGLVLGGRNATGLAARGAGPAGGAGDRPDGRARGVLLPHLERPR